MNACPVAMIRSDRSCLHPAHGSEPGLEPAVVSLDPVVRVAHGDVQSAGQHVLDDARVGGARSVVTSAGAVAPASARVKNRRAAFLSRLGDTSTSMTWPNWSTARYR